VRGLIPVGIASLIALGLLSLSASPVAAECSYLPPWPKATEAIPSAPAVIVGDVIEDFDMAEMGLSEETAGPRLRALRVTEVLRGDYDVGQLVDIEPLVANWPWAWVGGDEGGPLGSCSTDPGWPGDRIVLVLDAVQPTQQLQESGQTWVQPKTVYNAVGVLEAGPRGLDQRESVTMPDILRLVALPMTDTAPPPQFMEPDLPMPLAPLVLAGMLAGLLAWRRTSRPRPAAR